MTDTINTGLLLMAVGMGTVFCVLLLVVATGQSLIRIVNRFLPGEAPVAASVATPSDPSGAKIAAITAAVDHVTHGRGHITNIERLDS